MDEYGSWLKGSGKIVARLWTVSLHPPRFQMAVRRRCEFLSAEGDPARGMGITQRMVEQFGKTQELLGVSVLMGNGKIINVDDGEVAAGTSVKSTGSSPKKTSSFKGRCDGCGENGHKCRDCQKRSRRGGDDVRRGFQQSQSFSRSSESGKRSGISQS